MCCADSSVINVIVVDVVQTHSYHDNDEVDKAVVVAAAAAAAVAAVNTGAGKTGDRVGEERYRFRLDSLDGVHHESNAHSNRTPDVLRTRSLTLVVGSCDVGTMVDESVDNLCTDKIRSSFDVRRVIPFFDSYDIHAWLPYEFARLHCVDAAGDRGRIEMTTS